MIHDVFAMFHNMFPFKSILDRPVACSLGIDARRIVGNQPGGCRTYPVKNIV
jgi:hypothetical protein